MDYNECLRAFNATREFEEKYDQFFESQQKIDVTYEALIHNYTDEMRGIQEF